VSPWHADDPSFRSVMARSGVNSYTEKLLVEMGFVLLDATYWIWPAKHIDKGSPSAVWGWSYVEQDCPGKNENRLNDMIQLMDACIHQSMGKTQSTFTGYVKSSA